jgi:hypothetical protein
MDVPVFAIFYLNEWYDHVPYHILYFLALTIINILFMMYFKHWSNDEITTLAV